VVAVGAGGTLLVGSPGERLLSVPSGTERLLRGVALRGERIVAVGEAGTVVDSRDGGKSFTAKHRATPTWRPSGSTSGASSSPPAPSGPSGATASPSPARRPKTYAPSPARADGLVAVGARGTLLSRATASASSASTRRPPPTSAP
jgi:hypothetical protein